MDSSSGIDHTSAKFHLLHNRRLVLSVLILTQAYICFGYDASIIGGVLAMPAFIQRFGVEQADGTKILTASRVSVITATRTSGAIPAVFVCQYFGNKWGRKKTIWLGCAGCLVGTGLQTGSVNEAMITIGLLIANFGYFIMVSMASTLIVEISPPSVRGIAGALSAVAIGLMGVLSSGVAWGTFHYKSEFSFRLPLGLQNVFPIMVALGLLYIMDSPTSYLIVGDDANAEKSLRLFRHGYTEEEIAREMETLKWQNQLRKQNDEVKWYEIFTGTNLRRTLLGTFLAIIQNLSGAVFAGNYATIFLSQVGTANPFVLVFGLSILALGGAIIGLLLVDTLGRRRQLILAFLLLTAIDLAIGCVGFADKTKTPVIKAIAALTLLFGFVNAAGLGPIIWLIAAELPTARLRNVTNAWILLVISISNLTVTYVLPYIANADAGNLGPKTYLIFAFFMALGLVVSWLYWPETKGRTPAALDEMFGARLPARKFASYQSMLTDENIEVVDKEKGKLDEYVENISVAGSK